MQVLSENPGITSPEIAEALERHRNTIDYHMRRAVSEGKAHISGWKRNVGVSGSWAARYTMGAGVNAPEPKVTKRDRQRYSARHYKLNKEKKSLKGKLKRAIARGDGSHMWLPLLDIGEKWTNK